MLRSSSPQMRHRLALGAIALIAGAAAKASKNEPPKTDPMPMPMVAFLSMTAAWIAFIMTGIFTPRYCRVLASRYTFYAVPFVGSVYLKLAQSAISSYCEKIQAGETVCRPAPASLEENPWSDFMSIVPAALFLALLLQGLMQYLMSLFNPTKRNIAVSYTVVPCIGVHLFTMVYYTMEMAEPCVLLSHYGLETRPIHCFMWICSISAQTITLYGLEIEVLAERDPLQGSASAKRISELCIGLLSVQVMCWGGVITDVVHGWPVVQGAALLAAMCALYLTLPLAALRPLERCKQKYSKIDHLVVRFSALKSFVVFSWHLFPFVWFLGYLGLVNSMQVRLGLLICDVIAKFLPVSLYISSMTD